MGWIWAVGRLPGPRDLGRGSAGLHCCCCDWAAPAAVVFYLFKIEKQKSKCTEG